MIIQGTLDEEGNFVAPSRPTVFMDDGNGGGGSGGSDTVKIDPTQNTVKLDGSAPIDVAITAPVDVLGPLTNAQYTAITGAVGATAWSGTGNATLISILKALYAQNEEIKTLLNDIKTNTSA